MRHGARAVELWESCSGCGAPEFAYEALSRGGVANDNFATVRALTYHIAGHEAHHLNLVRQHYLQA